MRARKVAITICLVWSSGACEKKSSSTTGVASVERQPPETRPSDAGSPSPGAAQPVMEPMTACDIAKRFLERASNCVAGAANELKHALSNLETVIVEAQADKAPRSARERAGSMCALTAYTHDKHFSKRTDLACPIALSVDERTATRAYLDAYYARRTKPRPTGDTTLDRQLADLAASRDAMCGCADVACVEQTHEMVDAAVKPVPKDMPNAMDDSEAILDEVSRCSGRIEHGVKDVYP